MVGKLKKDFYLRQYQIGIFILLSSVIIVRTRSLFTFIQILRPMAYFAPIQLGFNYPIYLNSLLSLLLQDIYADKQITDNVDGQKH